MNSVKTFTFGILLLALLLAASVASARAASCSSALRQIGVAFEMYGQQNWGVENPYYLGGDSPGTVQMPVSPGRSPRCKFCGREISPDSREEVDFYNVPGGISPRSVGDIESQFRRPDYVPRSMTFRVFNNNFMSTESNYGVLRLTGSSSEVGGASSLVDAQDATGRLEEQAGSGFSFEDFSKLVEGRESLGTDIEAFLGRDWASLSAQYVPLGQPNERGEGAVSPASPYLHETYLDAGALPTGLLEEAGFTLVSVEMAPVAGVENAGSIQLFVTEEGDMVGVGNPDEVMLGAVGRSPRCPVCGRELD